MNVTEFSDSLRLLRKSRGLSLRAVAAQAGITPATLSYWETGKTRPRQSELNAVLGVLEASAEKRRSLLGLRDADRATCPLHRIEGLSASMSAGMTVPAVGGDLLWSMRLRKGWTQADTARAVGVHQAQIARWERGEAWPDAEKLHAFCWNLGASLEEVAALTTGAPDEQCPVALEEMLGGRMDDMAPIPQITWGCQSVGSTGSTGSVEGRGVSRGLDPEAGLYYLTLLLYDTILPDALLDLTMLTVEQRLSALAVIEQDAVAAALVPIAYAVHARHHLTHRRTRQAAYFAERGLTATDRRHKSAGAGMGRGMDENVRFAGGDHTHALWFSNVIVAAEVAASKKSHPRAGQRRAISLMNQWLPFLPRQNKEYRAWGISTLASVLSKERDQHDEALAMSEQSCNPELSPNPEDYLSRQFDRVGLLIGMGRYRQALDVLDSREMSRALDSRHPHVLEWRLPNRYYARHRQLHEDCLRGLKGQQQSE